MRVALRSSFLIVDLYTGLCALSAGNQMVLAVPDVKPGDVKARFFRGIQYVD